MAIMVLSPSGLLGLLQRFRESRRARTANVVTGGAS
jgi:hypothetical protein